MDKANKVNNSKCNIIMPLLQSYGTVEVLGY